MTTYDFIFTKKSPDKYYRHIIFWITQYLFWTFWAATFFENFTDVLKQQTYLNGGFILHAVYTYLIVYVFAPKYLETKQYITFSIYVFILTLFAYALFVPYLFWALDIYKESKDQQLLMTWYCSMNFIINGPPVVCAMFLTVKMAKNYYIKMEEKQILIKENANAEMQLLKAQVHPHFLFNTLNNIYSFTLNKSLEAGKLVLQLKDTTKYMVYECDAALVPLEKEIKMMQDYVALEKVRYGNRLKIEVTITGEYADKMITPLLLIPFVENSFKHGASKMLGSAFIKINIEIKQNILYFSLANNKPVADNANDNKRGIGLSNVKKRLQLLYTSEHYLLIQATEDIFIVEMHVPLQSSISKEDTIITKETISVPA